MTLIDAQQQQEQLLQSSNTLLLLRRALQQQNSGDTQETVANNQGNFVFVALIFALMLFFFVGYRCKCCDRSRGAPSQQRQQQLPPPRSRSASPSQPKPELKIDFRARLKDTTMQVESKDLIKRDDESSSQKQLSSGGEDKFGDGGSVLENVMFDVELGSERNTTTTKKDDQEITPAAAVPEMSMMRSSSRTMMAAENTVLQLPKMDNGNNNNTNNSKTKNANRVVPSTCAICLRSFKQGESISWSATPTCCHAYHTSCIVQYAEASTQKQRAQGKDDVSVPCPLCRNSFIPSAAGGVDEESGSSY